MMLGSSAASLLARACFIPSDSRSGAPLDWHSAQALQYSVMSICRAFPVRDIVQETLEVVTCSQSFRDIVWSNALCDRLVCWPVWQVCW